MMPLPPQIALCTTGALMISPSSWMASRLPMLARVAAQKERPPAELKVKLMIGRPPCCCSKVAFTIVEVLAADHDALQHRQALRLVAAADLLRRQARIGALDVSQAFGLVRRSSCMPSRVGTRKVVGGGTVCGMFCPVAATSSLTRWKVSLAVWLILRLRSVVSLMPGTCSGMRSSP